MNNWRHSVGWKFIVPTVGLLAVLLGSQCLLMVRTAATMTDQALKVRGETMTDFLAQIGKDDVSYYNLRDLDVITEEAAKDPEVVFAAYFDEQGKRLSQQEHPQAEPADDPLLMRFERALSDADGRPLGTLRVYLSRESVRRMSTEGISFLLLGLLFILLVSGAGIALVTRRVLRPIRELTEVAEEVVRTGNLRQDIAAGAMDEIGRLSTAFAAMVAKMRSALGSLKNASRLLDDSAGQLSTATREQGETLERQAQALRETHTTASEIQQTSTLAAQKAESVLQVMERADQASREGEASVDSGIQRLNEIREQVQRMTERISELADRARQIGSITDTVKDLADQSNMLALNAAIEAARSGENGKGFTVVAREFRSLADQSIEATQRVRDVLDDIGAAIRDAVDMTRSGVQRIETGLVEVRATGDSLRQLSAIVKENLSAARQIGSAVTQQGAGVHQIFLAVDDLQKVMELSLQRLQSTERASGLVAEVSRTAAGVVKDYQV
ncbi:methyl-accepting chemotaxis protein [Myxococcaceae bacterium GXIMD 01537]